MAQSEPESQDPLANFGLAMESAEAQPAAKGPDDPTVYLRNLINAYTDTIRLSDFKANIILLFAAIMMGPAIAYRGKYPIFLNVPLFLIPFLVVFICLLMCVLPRFPRRGKNNFLVVRNPRKSDFVFSENNEEDVFQLRLRCAILSSILYRKTLYLNIAFSICTISVLVTFVMLGYSLLSWFRAAVH